MSCDGSQKTLWHWPTTFLIVANCKSTLIGKDTEESRVSLEICFVLYSAEKNRLKMDLQCAVMHLLYLDNEKC